jgi:hypothetical protein
MPNIARTTPRPPARPQPQSAKTKIVLVRQPFKSVRRSDELDRTPVRLAIGVIVALGIVGVVWLMGFLGFRLGFANIMRVPDLRMEVSDGLATGMLILIGLPRVILEAGVAQPMWLMAGMALICIPAASLGAIKTPVRGGPRLKPAVVVLLYTAAIFAMLNAIGLMWWNITPLRSGMVTELPFNPADAAQWLENLRIVGGLDALGVVAAALWVVVAMRVAVPLWLRALASSVCLFVLVVMTVAFSITNATVAQATADRSVYFDDEGSIDPQLIVGTTQDYLVTLHVRRDTALRISTAATPAEPPALESDGTLGGIGIDDAPAPRTGQADIAVIEMTDRPAKLTVVGRQSIVDYMLSRQTRERS